MLRVAAKEPRRRGGYENHYRISAHGFRKINYLLTKQWVSGESPTASKQPPNLFTQTCTAQYLLNGTGTMKELFGHGFVKIASTAVNLSPFTDDFGSLLCSLDPTFVPLEMLVGGIAKQLPSASNAMLAVRASGLQQLGCIPMNIDIPLFVANAILRGCSKPMILFDLVLRGSMQLKTETARQKLSLQNERLKYQYCKIYEQLLEFENGLLKDECKELRQKLEEASLKTLSKEGKINRILEGLVIISNGLNKFPGDDQFVILMREFVQDSMIIIAAMACRPRTPLL